MHCVVLTTAAYKRQRDDVITLATATDKRIASAWSPSLRLYRRFPNLNRDCGVFF